MEANTLTVLLIEDSPQYAQLVQHWLAHVAGSAGFVLHWTDSLADGMSRLERGGVDVILLDLGLPDCSGMDTFKQTRSHAPRTPIVILSSADSEALALQMSHALALEVPLPRHIDLPGAAPIPVRTISSGMSRAGVR